MDISTLKALLDNISYSLRLSSCENLDSEPALKYLQKIEEILQLLKPVLDAIVVSEVVSDELLTKPCEELGSYIDETKELFQSWHQLKSKVFFVLQIESLVLKIQSSSLDILKVLRSLTQLLPEELPPSSLELCLHKIKQSAYEKTSDVIQESITNQMDGIIPSLESLKKIADCLNLKSNQDILIEAVALEKLKENAEQNENSVDAEYINQMISLVTHMHVCLILMQQSQSSSPVPIPPDFCCPLSLELMTDPVMVSSGQTYERAFIKNWIDHGLNVCPKTRQTLANTNLIPNYTVKALIANWCESNDVRLPDPVLSMKFPPSSPLHARTESAPNRDSHLVPQSSGTQPISPESTHSISSSETDLSLSGELHPGKPGPSHPRSPSGNSLSGPVRNGHGLDNGRNSQTGTEVPNPEERNIDSRGQQSPLQSRLEFSDANGDDKNLPHGHNRSTPSSSSLSNVKGSQTIHGDTNEASQTSAYSSDASGELPIEPPVVTLPSLRRESEPIQRVETRTRNRTFLRRPSERFAPRIVASPGIETRPDLSGIETQVREIIEDLNSTSVDIQREATEKLRLLAKHNMDNRIAIANCGAISMLVDLLRSTDSKIQYNVVTALLNLSINDINKNLIANANAIEPLIQVLETGSPEARENSAATLYSLSVMEENKARIGQAGAIPPLVDLLGNGTPRGKKDAATALYNLSIYHDNKAKILQAGAVKYLVELMDPAAGMADKAVAVLANLATIPEGRSAIGQGGGIQVLVEVVELGSARGKEHAAAALLQLCTNSSRFCSMVLQEGAVPPLVALSQTGTPRAKEKALGLLSCFRSHRHGNGGRG